MSVDAGIYITLAEHSSKIMLPHNIIAWLLNYGWTLDDGGKTSYLPVNDNESFAWQNEDISFKSLMNIVLEKESNQEVVGIAITWQNTGIGGTLLLYNNGKITFSVNINRQIIEVPDGTKVTDVTWYLIRFLPALNRSDCWVEHFTYDESR